MTTQEGRCIDVRERRTREKAGERNMKRKGGRHSWWPKKCKWSQSPHEMQLFGDGDRIS